MHGTSGSRPIKGEARVAYVTEAYAILSKAKLDGTIYVPANQVAQVPSVDDRLNGPRSRRNVSSLKDYLATNDFVEFVAVPQEEKNGAKWIAVDQSVRKTRETKRYSDEGTITHLDDDGQYGYIESTKGNVYFNANTVRPKLTGSMHGLKKKQRVHFDAVDQLANMCPWRATDVYVASRRAVSCSAAHHPEAVHRSRSLANDDTHHTAPTAATAAAPPTSFVTSDLTFSQIVSSNRQQPPPATATLHGGKASKTSTDQKALRLSSDMELTTAIESKAHSSKTTKQLLSTRRKRHDGGNPQTTIKHRSHKSQANCHIWQQGHKSKSASFDLQAARRVMQRATTHADLCAWPAEMTEAADELKTRRRTETSRGADRQTSDWSQWQTSLLTGIGIPPTRPNMDTQRQHNPIIWEWAFDKLLREAGPTTRNVHPDVGWTTALERLL